ncbi:MAG TPA: ThuA domain-containing protein [Methylomirabilota bacterium]|nr:ThuA domain-containing protein [Methylomirabilota bacterium]
MRLLAILALALCAALSHAADRPLKTLIVTGGHGFEATPFFQIFKDNTNITFIHAEHGKGSSTAYERDDLYTYDAVVLYDMVQEITEQQKSRFKGLMDRGIGLLVMHHAIVNYQSWPEFERIIGGTYPEPQDQRGKVTEKLGWEHDVTIPVQIVAKDHPVTKGVSDFTIFDEIYWGYRTGKDSIPLITTTHPKSGKPLAWARTEGKSRVVYLQLGHGPEAFENPNFRKLVGNALEWVARK